MSQKRRISPAGPRRKASNPVCLAYFLGFSAEEVADWKAKAKRGVGYADTLTADVTHIILNPKCSEGSLPLTKLYYAAVSGSWLLRPQWLLDDLSEEKHAYQENCLDFQWDAAGSFGLKEAIKLCRKYYASELKIFSSSIFQRVFFLRSSQETNEYESDMRSILEVSGALFFPRTRVDEILARGRSNGKVHLAISFTEDNTGDAQLINIFVKDGVPIVYYADLLTFIGKMESPTRDDLLALSESRYRWSSEEGAGSQQTVRSDLIANVSMLSDQSRSNSQEVGGGLPAVDIATLRLSDPMVFDTWLEYMELFPEYGSSMDFLKANESKLFYQPAESQAHFNRLISEFKTNTATNKVTEYICHSAASYLSVSQHGTFLPDAGALSFLLHNTVIAGIGRSLGASQTSFLLIKAILRNFPPRDIHSRMYWLKVFTPEVLQDKTTFDVREGIQHLRRLVVRAVGGDKEAVQSSLLSILLSLLEADQYLTEAQNKTGNVLLEPHLCNKDYHNVKNAELLHSPLPYLLVDSSGHNYEETINKEGKQLLNCIRDAVAVNERRSRVVCPLTRLHIVLLEAVYNHRKSEKTGEVHEYLKADIRGILRLLAKEESRKLKKRTLQSFYPIRWLRDLIDKLYV